ncbi:restriction endonuclease [Haloterrigena turkmenica]|nr:restriction endonuclease [Haloterrigena turkmenica]
MSVQEEERSELLPRLQNIDPIEFEHFVADLWSRQGWETEVSTASNDEGVDIVADKQVGGVDHRQVIQVKRYSNGNKIGRPDVQQYYALKVQDAKADAAVIVTTSTFTSTAKEWASEHNVKLIDGDDLVELIQEQRAYDLVEEYAPSLSTSSTDPVERSQITETQTELPDPLDDAEVRKKAGIGLGAIGLYLILNPTGIGYSIEAVGMLFLLGAIAVVKFPEQVWAAITPDKEVIREFSDGATVIEQSETVEYVPADDRDPVAFNDFEDIPERRQQANVYGSLDQTWGPLQELPPGSVPTDIAAQGQGTIVAYRYAVHSESPASIAQDMKMTQQEVIDHLTNIAKPD